MKTKKISRLNSLEELRLEKHRLQILAAEQKDLLDRDIKFIGHEYLGPELINKVSATVVPAKLRHFSGINKPINYIAKRFFGAREDVVNQKSDSGKGNRFRNVGLGLLEGAGTFLLMKFFKKKV